MVEWMGLGKQTISSDIDVLWDRLLSSSGDLLIAITQVRF